jgi:hypothetical protein
LGTRSPGTRSQQNRRWRHEISSGGRYDLREDRRTCAVLLTAHSQAVVLALDYIPLARGKGAIGWDPQSGPRPCHALQCPASACQRPAALACQMLPPPRTEHSCILPSPTQCMLSILPEVRSSAHAVPGQITADRGGTPLPCFHALASLLVWVQLLFRMFPSSGG